MAKKPCTEVQASRLLDAWCGRRPSAQARQGAARTLISARCASTKPAAQVAQLVEHVTENHGVGGSIPPLGQQL